MKNILILCTVCFFIIYWGATFFFIAPDNPLNVKKQKEKSYFNFHFSQRWDFFAPPPISNDRLYFSYYYIDTTTKRKKQKTFEILAPIILEKKRKVPFNRKQEAVDYIISGSVHELHNSIKDAYEIIDNEIKNKKYSEDEKSKLVIKILENTEDFKNLANYAKAIAKNNQLPIKHTNYKITITDIQIPKFIDKDSPKKKEENIIFSSNIHKLIK